MVKGAVHELHADIWHENLNGLTDFVDRHNRYAELEAAELLGATTGTRQGSFRGNWADRRRALKVRVWMKLPARPLIRFIWLYAIRQGFRDGRAGLIYCCLISWYDLLTNAMLYEMRASGRPSSVDSAQPHPRRLRAGPTSRADRMAWR